MLKKLNEVASSEHLLLEDDTDKAIVSLSGGDMRKVLNILESCSLGYTTITAKIVYEVTGRPSPSEIEKIYKLLTTARFDEAFEGILKIKKERSLAVEDIIRQIHLQVMNT